MIVTNVTRLRTSQALLSQLVQYIPSFLVAYLQSIAAVSNVTIEQYLPGEAPYQDLNEVGTYNNYTILYRTHHCQSISASKYPDIHITSIEKVEFDFALMYLTLGFYHLNTLNEPYKLIPECRSCLSTFASDGCGTGKTYTTLFSIVADAELLENQMRDSSTSDEEKAALDCRPHIILCPNGCLTTWVTELKEKFDGLLTVSIAYAHAEGQSMDPWMKSRTLPTNCAEAVLALRRLYPFNDIKGARHVILCSYSTYVKRFITKMPDYDESKQNELFTNFREACKCKC